MSRTTIDFGIDLGTTNSTIAVIDGTDAKVIPNKAGSGITPSAVWIDKRGNLHVGFEAKQRALTDEGDNGDLEFKLRMGAGAQGKKVFTRSGREMLPEDLSAEVLKSLKADVQTNLGEQVRAAVITVPAAFELPQTDATQKAAQLAGFARSPLLLEPVAASLAYGFQTESENVYWLVYDFGGGTFDAAVMRVRDGLIQVVNHDGDNNLGGKLLDWDIVHQHLVPAAMAQFDLPGFGTDRQRWSAALGTLKFHAETAKIEVCRTREPQEIWIEDLCKDASGRTVDFSYRLQPGEVEEISRPYVERSLGLCRKALEEKGLTGAALERVLMVGGSSLNPWVREAMQRELGARLEFGIDPVTVVARGAAIFASTQALAPEDREERPESPGTWRVQVEHERVGNVHDPEVGGRVFAPEGASPRGCTLELVDSKTGWRTGRMTLGPDGTFFTQLFAERKRRCEYLLELSTATGNRIPTSPDRIAYTIGVVPDKPPAAKTFGIGLANGRMCVYISKGTKLPEKKTDEHHTTVALRAGHAEDVVRIPLLEGEHPQARRCHPIGSLDIHGTDVHRDLPTGSLIEVTLSLDESQKLRAKAFVPLLDQSEAPQRADFDVTYELKMESRPLAELRQEASEQRTRLSTLREKAKKVAALKADAALARIDGEGMVARLEQLQADATRDPEALLEFDRRLRSFAAALDEVEDAVEWPALLEEAEVSRRDAEQRVGSFGDASEKNHLRALLSALKQATDAGDREALRQCIRDLDDLWYRVSDRRPEFHIARFNYLLERQATMQNPAHAEQLIAQGRRAINHDDLDGLKAANRQLIALLPRQVGQAEIDPRHIGGIV